MGNYPITGTGKTIDAARSSLDTELATVNKKLEKKNVPVLTDAKSTTFSIDCTVNPQDVPDFSVALQKRYSSERTFVDAENAARKGYGKIPFMIKSYSITCEYALKGSQKDVLEPPKPTPAYHERTRNADITRNLE